MSDSGFEVLLIGSSINCVERALLCWFCCVVSQTERGGAMMSDNRKIGTGLLALGGIFLFLGVMFFFDAGLLAIGDVLFLSGITMTIGTRRTFVFFFKRRQLRGNLFFFGGIALVFFNRPFFGMILQVVGFLNLFGPFIPIAVQAMRQVPLLGNFLSLPLVSTMVDKLAGSTSRGRRAPV